MRMRPELKPYLEAGALDQFGKASGRKGRSETNTYSLLSVSRLSLRSARISSPLRGCTLGTPFLTLRTCSRASRLDLVVRQVFPCPEVGIRSPSWRIVQTARNVRSGTPKGFIHCFGDWIPTPSLRHACGYRLANERRNAFEIQHCLGNTPLDMTRKYCALAENRFKHW